MPIFDNDTNVLTRPKTKPAVKVPKMYSVLFVNDDYTTMEFVVLMMMQVLKLDLGEATQAMLKVHQNGAAKVCRFPLDIAETKVMEINKMARENEHPLNVRAVDAD